MTAKRYDPRAPIPNPEIRTLVRAICEHLTELKRTRKYLEIKGHSVLLAIHAESLKHEPEFIYDLNPGPARTERPLELPDGSGAGLQVEHPFERPGADSGRYFYWTYGGGLTPLLTAEQLRLYDPMRLSGYWVCVFEKVFAGAQETRMHLRDDLALRRVRPRLRNLDLWNDAGTYALFLDPLGLAPGTKAPCLGRVRSLSAARRIADRLESWLEIRCLVARLTEAISTH